MKYITVHWSLLQSLVCGEFIMSPKRRASRKKSDAHTLLRRINALGWGFQSTFPAWVFAPNRSAAS